MRLGTICGTSFCTEFRAKQKNLRISTRVGVIRVISGTMTLIHLSIPLGSPLYQLTRWPASGQSQQRFANCTKICAFTEGAFQYGPRLPDTAGQSEQRFIFSQTGGVM